ncbi:MAG: protein kinase [Vicinamibacterales bacterium]
MVKVLESGKLPAAMDVSREDRIYELQQALAAIPANDWTAFLRLNCQEDASLREEVLRRQMTLDSGMTSGPVSPFDAPTHPQQVLAPGTRFGAYEIRGVLGVGGMGEVYRATDTRLGRDVALKVLPAAVATDSDRLARFDREARILATLNHPNIAIVHTLEESGGIKALGMELVEGPTLAERIARARIPLNETLAIAIQIARAVQAAHESHIVHRDLKPANIKVRDDGTVKVLDFGLAKGLERRVVEVRVADSAAPTKTTAAGTHPLTRLGQVLGTAEYMSPEQATGLPTDERSDVWAFGCVLYEMLTGRRPFGGTTTEDVLTAVVEQEPDWTSMPRHLPVPVRLMLESCLVKDRKKRLASMSTAVFVLEHAETLVPDDAARRDAEHRTSVRRIVAASLAMLAVGALAVWASLTFVRPPARALVRTSIPTQGATALVRGGLDPNLAVTRDGNTLVYRGQGAQLVVRSLDQLTPRTLAGLGAPRGLFLSPDGQWIGYFDSTSALRRVSLSGGTPVTMSAINEAPRGACWQPDGNVVFSTASSRAGLTRVSTNGGQTAVLTTPSAERNELSHAWPECLPGNRGVLFTIVPVVGSVAQAHIAVFDERTGTPKTLIRGGSHARYIPTGHLVYGAGQTLFAVPFDLERLELTGTPVPVLENIAMSSMGMVEMGVTDEGTLVYLESAQPPRRTLAWVDRAGREEPVPAPARAYRYVRLSPDNTRLALDIREQDNDIWIWDFVRATLTRLTSGPRADEHPIWMTDSQRVIFSSDRDGIQNIYWQRADGTGAAERLTQSENEEDLLNVSPNGLHLLFKSAFRGPNSDRNDDLMVAAISPTVSAPLEQRTLIKTRFQETDAVVSPNGRWLAYTSDESGRDEIYVRPFPDVAAGRWQVSSRGGAMPVWSPDGRELYFFSEGEGMAAADVGSGASWQSGRARFLFAGDYLLGEGARTYDISADGQRFVLIKNAPPDPAVVSPSVVVVQNWFSELQRLAPSR